MTRKNCILIQRLLSTLWALAAISLLFLQHSHVFAQSPRLYVESGIHHSARAVAISPDRKFVATGSIDLTIKIWSLNPPRELLTLPNNKQAYCLAFHPMLPIVAGANSDGTATVWDFRSEKLLATLAIGDPIQFSLAFSDSGDLLCVNARLALIKRWTVPQFSELDPISIRSQYPLSNLRLLGQGRLIAGNDADGVTRIVDTQGGKELCKLDGKLNWVESIAFAAKRSQLVTADISGSIRQWSIQGGKEIAIGEKGVRALKQVHYVAFSADDRLIACALESGDIVILNGSTWQEWGRLKSLSNRVERAGLPEREATLAIQVWYDTKVVWDLTKGQPLDDVSAIESSLNDHRWEEEGVVFAHPVVVKNRAEYVQIQDPQEREICTIILLDKQNSWVVVTPDGRFDTNMDLSRIAGAHWVMSNDPFHPQPLEIFLRDYYEPHLLNHVLRRENTRSVPVLASLNRVQPEVKILSVQPERLHPYQVTVTVEIKSKTEGDGAGKVRQTRHSDVYDLRLFRDGQIVGQMPVATDPRTFSSRSFNPTDPRTLADWRSLTLVKQDASVDVQTGRVQRLGAVRRGRRHRVVFSHVRLPHRGEDQSIEFSAYAFNEDRVKSETDRMSYALKGVSR